jgi:hypothetical protein
MIDPVILFRQNFNLKDSDISEEFKTAQNFFHVYEYRNRIPPYSLVFGRYSCLPFYKELEQDLKSNGSLLINSYDQHTYIADIMNYYRDIEAFTPKTFETWANLPEGKYVVKGRTNSRKFRWNTHMFANNKQDLIEVVRRLLDDEFIADQGLIVREYVPLRQIDEGLNGLPISNEYRLFFYKDQLLCSGFYWASHFNTFTNIPQDGLEFAKKIAKIVSKNTNFFVMDVAEKADGGWIVIELNDAQMSGLSLCDPEVLYSNLKKELIEE